MDPSRPASLSPSGTVSRLIAAQGACGAERARLEDELVRSYLPMTRRLAARFGHVGADADDLVQVANVGLVKAIRGFDASRGAFESYAKATISGELKKYLRDYCWSIRPPRRVQELQADVIRTSETLAQEEGAVPGSVELAEAMHASVSDIGEALSARSCYSPASLDGPSGTAGRPLGEFLADAEEPYAQVDGWVALGQICSGLSDEDRTLIRLRFYECMSQREIADEIGISQMQVSRRLTRMLDGLRARALQSDVA
jgi:RNA polymerase sigma-B factor